MILRGLLLKLWRRRRLQQDLEAELAFHCELARKHGNPIALGHTVRIQEEARDLWRFTLLEDLSRDVAYAIRSLRRARGFAAIAILTLALGIGANTAIFSLIHRVMLSPLPVGEPSQLIELLTERGSPSGPGIAFSYDAFQKFRRCTQACAGIIAFSNTTFHAVIDGSPMERLSAQFVPGDYFSKLGIETAPGRPITPEDDRAASTVAVISHAMWRDRFSRSPDVLGKTIILQDVPFTIVGIAPAGYHGLEVGRQNSVWVPLESERNIRRPSFTSSPSYKWIQLAARVKPGATMEQTHDELGAQFNEAIETEVASLTPPIEPSLVAAIKNQSLLVEPAGMGFSRTRRDFSRLLKVLMAIVGVLLLIACTNVANLLFARALSRDKEIALRLSLGARRARVIRQLLTESAVLVVAGGTLGLFMAYWLTDYLSTLLASANAPTVLDMSPNLVTLGFTSAVAILTVVLFGLVPAFRSTNMDFASRLKGTLASASAGTNYWSRGLVVLQVALLMVLIVGAGLFLRTLHNLNSIDLGFDRSNVLMVNVDPFGSGHSPEQLKVLSLELLQKMEALPAVRTASVSRYVPLSGGSGTNLTFDIHRESGNSTIAPSTFVNYVGPKYFAVTMVLREVFVLVGAGIIVGLPLAFALTRSIASLLYGLTPDDPLNVIAAVMALLVAALAAGLVPAMRAARVDPMVALRIE